VLDRNNVRFWQMLLKKSFLADERNFFRTADALRTRRREGPQRFAQKRPPTFAVEASKYRLSRDFGSLSISAFCNSIGAQERKCFVSSGEGVSYSCIFFSRI
jgi:hypothetical protein